MTVLEVSGATSHLGLAAASRVTKKMEDLEHSLFPVLHHSETVETMALFWTELTVGVVPVQVQVFSTPPSVHFDPLSLIASLSGI